MSVYYSKYSGKEVEDILDLMANITNLPVVDMKNMDYIIGLSNGKLTMTNNPYKIYTTVGDVMFYDNEYDKKIFVGYDDLSADVYSSDRYTPIGIVVIPEAHDVYGTGEGAAISLMDMSYNTPDDGSKDELICWGYNHSLLGSAYATVVQTGTAFSPTSEATGSADYPFMPSDNFENTLCPTDPEAYYGVFSDNACAPSPYLNEGEGGGGVTPSIIRQLPQQKKRTLYQTLMDLVIPLLCLIVCWLMAGKPQIG